MLSVKIPSACINFENMCTGNEQDDNNLIPLNESNLCSEYKCVGTRPKILKYTNQLRIFSSFSS